MLLLNDSSLTTIDLLFHQRRSSVPVGPRGFRFSETLVNLLLGILHEEHHG